VGIVILRYLFKSSNPSPPADLKSLY